MSPSLKLLVLMLHIRISLIDLPKKKKRISPIEPVIRGGKADGPPHLGPGGGYLDNLILLRTLINGLADPPFKQLFILLFLFTTY
jgi:hypothetical protein